MSVSFFNSAVRTLPVAADSTPKIESYSAFVDKSVGAKVKPSKGSTPVLPEIILFCNKINFFINFSNIFIHHIFIIISSIF